MNDYSVVNFEPKIKLFYNILLYFYHDYVSGHGVQIIHIIIYNYNMDRVILIWIFNINCILNRMRTKILNISDNIWKKMQFKCEHFLKRKINKYSYYCICLAGSDTYEICFWRHNGYYINGTVNLLTKLISDWIQLRFQG